MADEQTQDTQAQPSDETQNTESQTQAAKTFTQDDIDKIVSKRLERERKSWQEQLTQEQQRAQMTAEEKLKADLDAERSRSQQTMQAANERAIRADVRSAAAELGIKSDQFPFLLKLADLSEVTVDEHGDPDSAAIKTAIEAVVNAFPAIKGAPASIGSGSNPAGASNAGGAAAPDMEAALKTGNPSLINAAFEAALKAARR